VFYLGIVLIEPGTSSTVDSRFFTRGERPRRRRFWMRVFLARAIWILGGFVLGLVNGIYWAPLAALTTVLVMARLSSRAAARGKRPLLYFDIRPRAAIEPGNWLAHLQ
jgi:uncharacterized iron-regulated membrane protein